MKFFHATASQRRRKNRILGLQNLNGVWQEYKEGVEGIIMDYFTSIYRLDQLTNFEAILSAISNQFSLDMNEELTAEFKADEVWSVLKQKHPTKSLIPDGMPLFSLKTIEILLALK